MEGRRALTGAPLVAADMSHGEMEDPPCPSNSALTTACSQ